MAQKLPFLTCSTNAEKSSIFFLDIGTAMRMGSKKPVEGLMNHHQWYQQQRFCSWWFATMTPASMLCPLAQSRSSKLASCLGGRHATSCPGGERQKTAGVEVIWYYGLNWECCGLEYWLNTWMHAKTIYLSMSWWWWILYNGKLWFCAMLCKNVGPV